MMPLPKGAKSLMELELGPRSKNLYAGLEEPQAKALRELARTLGMNPAQISAAIFLYQNTKDLGTSDLDLMYLQGLLNGLYLLEKKRSHTILAAVCCLNGNKPPKAYHLLWKRASTEWKEDLGAMYREIDCPLAFQSELLLSQNPEAE